MTSNPYPDWICAACGEIHGKGRCGLATWHMGTCDVCKTKNTPITEPRDFGHLKESWKDDR